MKSSLVRRTLRVSRKLKHPARAIKARSERFQKIHERAVKVILETIAAASAPISIPALSLEVARKTSLRVSKTWIRRFLIERLGMRYRVIGKVSKLFDSDENVLKR
jgi:hypothetical protein